MAWLRWLKKYKPWADTDLDPEDVSSPEKTRASTTAMLDGVIAKVKADATAHEQEVQVASRRATNASRKVVIRTGTFPSLADQSLAEEANARDSEPET